LECKRDSDNCITIRRECAGAWCGSAILYQGPRTGINGFEGVSVNFGRQSARFVTCTAWQFNAMVWHMAMCQSAPDPVSCSVPLKIAILEEYSHQHGRYRRGRATAAWPREIALCHADQGPLLRERTLRLLRISGGRFKLSVQDRIGTRQRERMTDSWCKITECRTARSPRGRRWTRTGLAHYERGPRIRASFPYLSTGR
jgi:hypothetical protein